MRPTLIEGIQILYVIKPPDRNRCRAVENAPNRNRKSDEITEHDSSRSQRIPTYVLPFLHLSFHKAFGFHAAVCSRTRPAAPITLKSRRPPARSLRLFFEIRIIQRTSSPEQSATQTRKFASRIAHLSVAFWPLSRVYLQFHYVCSTM